MGLFPRVRRNNGAPWRKFKIKEVMEGLVLSIKCPSPEVTHTSVLTTHCVELVTWPQPVAESPESVIPR